jgi:WD40 repeat protein
MTNLVAYRGHQNPVWDVKWSPMGVYFATASRDRTARLWSTDRTTALRIYAGHLSDVDVGSSARLRGLILNTLAVPGLPSKLTVSSDGIE